MVWVVGWIGVSGWMVGSCLMAGGTWVMHCCVRFVGGRLIVLSCCVLWVGSVLSEIVLSCPLDFVGGRIELVV